MNLPAQFDRASADTFLWQRFDPVVKANLFATAFATRSGLWLVDPFPVGWDELAGEIGQAKPAGVIVTNENHLRASAEFADRFDVPVYAHANAHIEHAREIGDLPARLAGEVMVLEIEGGPGGEIALHSAAKGGTMIVGDALINFGAHGFDFLPAKYCSNQKRMRSSLRQLLDFEFARLFFAHGEPILDQARPRLEKLFDAKRAP